MSGTMGPPSFSRSVDGVPGDLMGLGGQGMMITVLLMSVIKGMGRPLSDGRDVLSREGLHDLRLGSPDNSIRLYTERRSAARRLL